NIRQGDLGVLHRFIPHAEQVDLSLDVLPAALCDRVHDRAADLEQLAAAVTHGIERARLDQAFQRAAIKLAVIHALTKILKRGEQAARLALLYELLHERASHALDRREAEADIPSGDREAVKRLVDVRRQDRDAHL